MKIGILQLNYTVGDLEGNTHKIINAVNSLKKNDVDLFITSELSVLGYFPKDLLLNHTFIKKSLEKVSYIANVCKEGPAILLGAAIYNNSREGKPLYNAAFLLKKGKISGRYFKNLLPTYDVFEENRYFESGITPSVYKIGNKQIGITICEDIWNDKDYWYHPMYKRDPVESLMKHKVDYIVNLSASPFTVGKQKIREQMLVNIAKKYSVSVIYVNQVGGNDDLVFDGRSCVISKTGSIISKSSAFKEDVRVVDLNHKNIQKEENINLEEEIWEALVLGTKDYITKCGFKTCLIGLSGGIDSAVTAAIAVEAVGNTNVLGVLMPSPFTSKASVEDATTLARNLKIKLITIPILSIMATYNDALEESFSGYPKDITEENIQARIRGNILMALSNKFHSLLLSTGNKSELSVGYCTIYGDISGGLAVIADVPKTLVYRLANWFNTSRKNSIPSNIILKAPTAELRQNQKDQDSLPPYEVLDEILLQYIENHKSAEEIIKNGYDKNTVKKVITLIKKAEFKRRQAPLGIKITDRAFSTGWKMPIASKFTL